MIFDTFRKTWVYVTEEEWVRQNFLSYLTLELKYPAALIAVEKEIKLYELIKRFDILVYDSNHKPWMLVECKAPQVKLNDDVLQQVLRYNISVPVNYVVITNGHLTYAFEKKQGKLSGMSEMPSFK